MVVHRSLHQSDESKSTEKNEDLRPLSADLEHNLKLLEAELAESSDIVMRTFANRGFASKQMTVLYIDGIVDSEKVNRDLLESLLKARAEAELDEARLFRFLTEEALPLAEIDEVGTLDELLIHLFNGYTIILLDGCSRAVVAGTAGGEKRGVEEPSSQTVIRGPKEGFTESLGTNLSLIRRRIKSPKLSSQTLRIGRMTQTNVALVFLKGVAKEAEVDEIRLRLEKIETDGILESGYIEELIQDAPFSPFPLIQNTERPDAAVAGILEGQIVIIVDGTPFVLMAPVTFVRFFQSSEDYYQRYDISSFLRIVRFTSFFVSMLLPALYISITTFHQEMLPTPLLISLAAQREGVPFPALIEALLMELTFEVLREAGVRMPRAIGPAISIVGALVLGQAAVQAGLVSAAMVIVVSFTAISNFVIPAISMSITSRLIRFGMMFLGGSFGLFGIMSGLMILLIHLAGLRSFGVPYLAPLAPFSLTDMKDVFVRFPRWAMATRPSFLASPRNRTRVGSHQKPAPPDKRSNEEGGEQS